MTARGWQEAFLAMSTVLGEPLEAALAAMTGPVASGALLTGPAAGGLPLGVPEADAARLVVALRSGLRDVRARGLARALMPVVEALVEAQLA